MKEVKSKTEKKDIGITEAEICKKKKHTQFRNNPKEQKIAQL